MAIKVFTRALETNQLRLKALIKAGLAYCYAQQFHRLAKREADVLAKAQEHADQASRKWEEVGSDSLHPLILSTLALVRCVDEETDETREDVFLCLTPISASAPDHPPRSHRRESPLEDLI